MLATRLGGECAERLGQPTLVGELLAGLELKPADIVESSRAALAVALGGMVLTLTLGFVLAWWALPESDVKFAQALFMGTAMAITAVPVTVKILMDLGKLRSPVGKVLVSAAVYDDIASLILLAIITAVITQGALPDLRTVAWLLAKVAGFFVVAILLGLHVLPWLGSWLKRRLADEFEFSMLIVAAMAYAVIGELLGLHFIIGAFLAGLFFRRRTIDDEVYEATRVRISGITIGFLAPIFFASIGFNIDLAAVTEIPGLLLLIVIIAFAGKLIGGALPASWSGLSFRDTTAIGAGMCARGAWN